VTPRPIDPAQRRLAERRLLDVLRRHARRQPLHPDLRIDTLVAELRTAEPKRPAGHRGAQRLTLDDGELRLLIDEMVTAGVVLRQARRVQLVETLRLDPQMQARIDQLLAALSESGFTPLPAERVARRLGIPLQLLDQLRASGELVTLAGGIDYPRSSWAEIEARLQGLEASGPLSVRAVRDELGTTRRHAEAILRHRRQRRSPA